MTGPEAAKKDRHTAAPSILRFVQPSQRSSRLYEVCTGFQRFTEVYLWRAVDHEGEVLESYVTKTRDKATALTLMKKAMKRHGSPESITTDGLRSYKAAMTELGC